MKLTPVVIVSIEHTWEVAWTLVALEPDLGDDVKVVPLSVQEHLSIEAKPFVAKVTWRLTLGIGRVHFFLCEI